MSTTCPGRLARRHSIVSRLALCGWAVLLAGCGEGGAKPPAERFKLGGAESAPPPPPATPIPGAERRSAEPIAAAAVADEAAPPAPAQAASAPAGDQVALGQQVFEAQRCGRCHRMEEGGQGGPGPGGPGPGGPGGPRGRGPGGPSLAHVGSKPDRTPSWLADHVRDPKSHNPGSRMPAFGPDKISDPDLDALGEYLASLK